MPKHGPNLDLSVLNSAEELWLWRSRQPSNARSKYRRGQMSRAEAAKFLGMSLERYKNLEAGRRINVAADELPSLSFLHMPRPEMSLREQIILARRRSGLFIRQIAEEFGLSHTRMLAHEDTGSRRLIDYWSNKGFHGWNLPVETIPRPVPVQPRPRPQLVRRGTIVPPPVVAPPPPPQRPQLLRRAAV